MSDSIKLDEMLEVASQVLIRSLILGAIVLLVWMVAIMLIGDLIYTVHSGFFPLSREQFDLVHYCGMLITKAALFVLFLCPYVGIRLVLGKRRQ